MKVLRGPKGQSQIRNPKPVFPLWALPSQNSHTLTLGQPQHKGVSILNLPACAHTMLMGRYQEWLHRKTLARRPQYDTITVYGHNSTSAMSLGITSLLLYTTFLVQYSEYSRRKS
jgi:hypothetical protein